MGQPNELSGLQLARACSERVLHRVELSSIKLKNNGAVVYCALERKEKRDMKKLASIAILIVLLSSIVLVAMPTKVASAPIDLSTLKGGYTPNLEKLVTAAIKRGELPANPTNDQMTSYLQAYLAQKMVKSMEEHVDPLMADRVAKRDNGQDIGVDPNIDPFGTDKMLVLLVEFEDSPANPLMDPLHNKIPAPGPRDTTTYWISDFNTAHYQSMLFDATPGSLSMHNYYLEQSYGLFTVTGTVYGWVKLPHPESYYGADNPAGGTDNLNGDVSRIVKDAIDAANVQIPSIPWASFTANGVSGFLQHFAIVHAGEDQAAGGGLQGDNAIWSHSSSYYLGPYEAAPGVYALDYTIMPENGNLGVFCHEFGHDIGLPDSYDTIYSGDSSPAFWDLMAMGSWLGTATTLDTMPSHISIWGKQALGWLNYGAGGNAKRYNIADPALQSGIDVEMKQVETSGGIKAIRVDLPLQVIEAPHSGSGQWYSGTGVNMADEKLTRTVDLTGKTSATLDFWTWYNLEPYWDYGFVQVSTNGGTTWTSLSDNEGRTTSDHEVDADPSIVANLPGFTGPSNGWIHETFNLPTGNQIKIRFRYMTDPYTTLLGWYLDDISVVADGSTMFFDNVETLDPGWTYDGWTRTGPNAVSQYYMMEWRNFVGFDKSLQYCYHFASTADYADGYAQRFSYNPGLLLWYRNTAYSENWVGVHPGRGYLLVVDSHPAPIKTPVGGYTFATRYQVQDATFSLQRTISNTLSYTIAAKGISGTQTYPSLHGQPIFDDSKNYNNPSKEPRWVQSANYPYNLFKYGFPSDDGTIVPTFGLRTTVTSQATDNAWGNIRLLMQK